MTTQRLSIDNVDLPRRQYAGRIPHRRRDVLLRVPSGKQQEWSNHNSSDTSLGKAKKAGVNGGLGQFQEGRLHRPRSQANLYLTGEVQKLGNTMGATRSMTDEKDSGIFTIGRHAAIATRTG
jgi:hypothetical protein